MKTAKRYLNEREAAELIGFSRQALANQRWQRKGLPYIKIGGSIRYDLDDVIKYMESHKIVLQ